MQLKREAFANRWADNHAEHAIQHGCFHQLQKAIAAALRRKIRKEHLNNLFQMLVQTADLHLAEGRKDERQARTLQADLSGLQPSAGPSRGIVADQEEAILALDLAMQIALAQGHSLAPGQHVQHVNRARSLTAVG